MKTTLLILATFLLSYVLQAQTFEWATRAGGSTADVGHAVVADALGNVYTTGYFEVTATFGAAGSVVLNSNGMRDIFVTKHSPQGDLVWAKNMGGTQDDEAFAIACDATGHLYITGFFQSSANFDPNGIFTLTSSGLRDVFLCKLDTDGNFLWANKMGGSGWDIGLELCLDNSNNVYVTGNFEGTANFSPTGTSNLISAGLTDLFVCKFDHLGNLIWAQRMGGFSNESGQAIATDQDDNVIITGRFELTANFNPSGTFNLSSSGNRDIVVVKLTSAGQFLWAVKMGGTGADEGRAVAVDAANNIVVAGSFAGTANFNPAGTSNLVSSGLRDMFFVKLTPAGVFMWAEKFGGTGEDVCLSIDIDQQNNVYASGYFTGNANFGTNTLAPVTSNGNVDALIGKLSTLGQPMWTTSFGSTDFDVAYELRVDAAGSIYSTGEFTFSPNFNPEGSFTLTSSGMGDAFTLKHSTTTTECNPSFNTIVASACNELQINNIRYTTSGTYTQTLINQQGCDSILSLVLTIYAYPDASWSLIQGFTGWMLTPNYWGATTYHWINCDNNAVVYEGPAVNDPNNGNYALQVVENGCLSTSDCMLVDIIGINEFLEKTTPRVYPNPTNEQTHLAWDHYNPYHSIIIRNYLGQEIMREQITGRQLVTLNLPDHPGVYYAELINELHRTTLKLVKQ